MIVPKCLISAGNGVIIEAGSIYHGPGCSMHGGNYVDITADYTMNQGSITAGKFPNLPNNPDPHPIFDMSFEEFEQYIFEEYLNTDWNWDTLDSIVPDSNIEPALELILTSDASTETATVFPVFMALVFHFVLKNF